MNRAGRCWLLLAPLLAGGCGGVSSPGDGADDDGADDGAEAEADAASSADAKPSDADVTGPGDPVVLSIVPDWGSTAGGTRVQINGSGFSVAGLTVSFGGEPGEDIAVESDGRLTVLAPPGPHEAVAVQVTNDEGSASGGPFRYLAPLYAADGRVAVAGNLYIVNQASAETTPIGPVVVGGMGVSITGLELSPDGVLFAASNGVNPRLLTIDPYTALATEVGPLAAGADVAGAKDLAFLGDRLLGWRLGMTEIDPATGQVTELPAAPGIGIASAPDGTLFHATACNGALSTVDPDDGAVTAGPTMNGPDNSVNALVFVGTTLYGSIAVSQAPSALYTIDTATGQVTLRGPMTIGVDALAGIPAPPDELAGASASPSRSVLAPIPAASPAPACPDLTIARPGHRRALAAADLLALGVDRDLDRRRRIVPLRSLRRLSPRARSVELVACSGERAVLALDSADLALTANHRGRIKLIDARAGARAVLADLVELRLR